MIVALVISLILNVLFMGGMLYINESWYRNVIRIIEESDKEYSRMNNEWAEFCKKQIDDAVNGTKAAMKEDYKNEENSCTRY